MRVKWKKATGTYLDFKPEELHVVLYHSILNLDFSERDEVACDAVASNAARATAKIINALVDKRLITLDEALEIAGVDWEVTTVEPLDT